MMEVLRVHQLNMMIGISSISGLLALFVCITRTLSKDRRRALFLVNFLSMLLMVFDRFAYLYRGDVSSMGYYMVRISNFMVYFLPLATVIAFNMYLADILKTEAKEEKLPKRLLICNVTAGIGEIMVITSQFTGIYYTFDKTNHYVRGSAFLISYIFPLIILFMQLSIAVQYYKRIHRRISMSLLVFTIAPLVAALLQIFLYGLSLTNLAIAGVGIILYVFALADMGETAEKARKREIAYWQESRQRLQKLFDQMATTFVNAMDARVNYTQGHSLRVARYSARIAELCGKTEEECQQVYYAALLHDIGKMGLPDSLLKKEGELTPEENEQLKQKALIGEQILTEIADVPYLSVGAHYHQERYDGSGYPERRIGEDIPEMARIIAVADAYDMMMSKTGYRDALPRQVVREELMKESGSGLDPKFVGVMLQMLDSDMSEELEQRDAGMGTMWQNAFSSEEYRSVISYGIKITDRESRIRFLAEPTEEGKQSFSAPAIILYDSLDGRVHDTERTIRDTRYIEYGELWFDGHSINSNARNMKITVLELEEGLVGEEEYMIEAVQYRDHLRVRLLGQNTMTEAIVALPDSSGSSFLGLTGEHCQIREINMEQTEQVIEEGEIPRIAEEISYINRLESDVPNIQIDGFCSAITPGFLLSEENRLYFHTMSLPTASLVWQCPFLVLFTSEDGLVNGKNYREYALIRLNGEKQEDSDGAVNKLTVEKKTDFTGWEEWKEINKKGMECLVKIRRKKNTVILETENAGLFLKNQTTIKEPVEAVYVALTGDKCALTDIRML